MFPVANKLVVKMFVSVRVLEHVMLPVMAKSLIGTFDGSTMRCTIPGTRYEIFWAHVPCVILSVKDPVDPVRLSRFVAITVTALDDVACLYGTTREHPSGEQFER